MSKFSNYLIIILSIFIFNCSSPSSNSTSDEVKREKHEEIFIKCLNNIPKGPDSTVMNDWEEVIMACQKHADASIMNFYSN